MFYKIINLFKRIGHRIWSTEKLLLLKRDRSNNEEIKVKVIYIHIYSSFKELYNDFDKISLGYKSNEISDYRDMYKYYSKELIEKYGVVGIEVELYEGDNI